MRTTIVLDDALAAQVRTVVRGRRLSEFIGQCLREYFERRERAQRMRKLEQAYERAAKRGGEHAFEALDREEWPEW
ncbi:MAG: type II toxin-antitoxin system VapB family antitoxin [Deltaproteobacteria bacterium]|nr:type II toxin-antitoxin system VapB family antitoxin [Deltaproteobacteria bacterium]